MAVQPTTLAEQKIASNNVECTPHRCAHADNDVQFYCLQHDICLCKCFYIKHKLCKNVGPIADFLKNMTGPSENTHVLKELSRLLDACTKCLNASANSDREGTERSYVDVIAEIRTLRREIDNIFNNIESKFLAETKSLKETCFEKFQLINKSIESLQEDISTTAKELEMITSSTDNSKLFIATKKSKSCLKQYELKLNQLKCALSLKTILTFEPHTQLLDDLKNIQTFGNLSTRNICDAVEGNKHVQLQFVKEIKVKSMDNYLNCDITGIAVFPDGNMIVVDQNNRAVKLFDNKDAEVLNTGYLEESPNSVVINESGSVAVSFPRCNTIKVFSISMREFKLDEEISTDKQYDMKGMAYSKKCACFLVCLHSTDENLHSSIQIIDGNINRKIPYLAGSSLAKPLYACPYDIAFNSNTETIYVIDYVLRVVSSIHLINNSNKTREFNLQKLKNVGQPTAIVLDKYDIVYISCINAIVALSADLMQVQTISLDLGIIREIQTISYCSIRHQLYMSSTSMHGDFRNYVKVFQLPGQPIFQPLFAKQPSNKKEDTNNTSVADKKYVTQSTSADENTCTQSVDCHTSTLTNCDKIASADNKDTSAMVKGISAENKRSSAENKWTSADNNSMSKDNKRKTTDKCIQTSTIETHRAALCKENARIKSKYQIRKRQAEISNKPFWKSLLSCILLLLFYIHTLLWIYYKFVFNFRL